jgi:hypothetical protein
MIDNFALGVTHFLMLVAVWRLLFREELDQETGQVKRRHQWGKRPNNDA